MNPLVGCGLSANNLRTWCKWIHTLHFSEEFQFESDVRPKLTLPKMKENDIKLLDMDLADAIVDRPHGFTIGSRHFYLYPLTLGKMFMLGRLVEELGINQESLELNPYLEAIRCARYNKELCCRIITYHTIRTKAKSLDAEFISNRTKFFTDNLDEEDVATTLVMVMTCDKTEQLIHHLNIDKEQKRMKKAIDSKDSRNTMTFGGTSIYGSLIDTACERYGWTYDYVVWEISYTNLKLMLADSVKQVYLTDDEIKKSGLTANATYINGDDPEEMKRFIESMKGRGN